MKGWGWLMVEPQAARTMSDPETRAVRLGMLAAPHMVELVAYAKGLEAEWGEVPLFDPMDGGVEAELLFLFEKPGPMTSGLKEGRRAGSGFISRDNDDPTAQNTFTFMRNASIPRRKTLLWNVVPGWNGTRKIVAAELRSGVAEFANLLNLLPKVRGVVLVGAKAGRARSLIERLDAIPVFASDHPSPIVHATRPERWGRIGNVWRQAAADVGLL